MFEPKNKSFFESLLADGDISLFASPNLQAIVTFQWTIFWPCYLRRIFLPFMLLFYIPFLVIVLTDSKDENGYPTLGWFQIVSGLALALYLIWGIFLEYIEMKSTGLKAYLTTSRNIFDGAALGIILYCWIAMAKVYSYPAAERDAKLPDFRIMLVWGILM